MIAEIRDERHDPHDPDLYRVRCPDCGDTRVKQRTPSNRVCPQCNRLKGVTRLSGDVDMKVWTTRRGSNVYHEDPDCYQLNDSPNAMQKDLSVIESHYEPCSVCSPTEVTQRHE